MRILSALASLVCLVSGCVLWLVGFQTAGAALAVSSAVLILVFSVVRPSSEGTNPDKLERRLDWGLVVAGLVGYAVTRDLFFLVSVGVFVVTSPGIMETLKGRRAD